MKIVIKNILAVSIIVGLCVILVAMMLSRPETGDKEISTDIASPNLPEQAQMNWPMFRGGQSLLGTAAGSLPDSLQLLWKFKTGAEIKSSPAIDNDLVFIGSADANALCRTRCSYSGNSRPALK